MAGSNKNVLPFRINREINRHRSMSAETLLNISTAAIDLAEIHRILS